jgi:hypothetical protein
MTTWNAIGGVGTQSGTRSQEVSRSSARANLKAFSSLFFPWNAWNAVSNQLQRNRKQRDIGASHCLRTRDGVERTAFHAFHAFHPPLF